MKKVLEIPTGLYVAGAQKIARDIGLQRNKNRFEVQYVVFDNVVDQYEKDLTANGCAVHHFPLPTSIWKRIPAMYSALKKLMRKEQYDVVHAHCMFQSGIVMLAANHAGVPIRITHSHNTSKVRHPFSGIYDAVMRRLILANATELVGCGHAAGEYLFGKKAFRKRGKVILNGIDVDRFCFREEARRAKRAELLLDGRFVIGNVARLGPAKNQAFLIRLMPEILKRRPEALLLLVGEGTERSGLEQLIHELRLEKNVLLTGSVSDVESCLCAMDVLALPSLFEGIPLTVLEAQANGLPCLISENVPEETVLTDLVRTIPLNRPADWIHGLCTAERPRGGQYAEELRVKGADHHSMLNGIYALYGRD